MRIGFFGTPGIASYVLEGLCSKFDVAFLVSPEDKKCGRNMKIQHCAAKETALCKEVPVLQPSSLKDPGFAEELRSYNADIFVVVAYGKLIPESIFNIPPLGTINLHPSLLPKYRGAAPIQWALINGDTETGVTVQIINKELDAGDIVLQEKLPINENMTADELYEEVLPLGADLVIRSIELLSSGKANLRKQDHKAATFCGKISRETACIDWNREALQIHNLVKGLNPRPVAWTTFRGCNMKIWATSVFREEEDGIDLQPGELMVLNKKRLLAGTGRGILEIKKLQPENRKAMDALGFINGQRLQAAEKFE